MLQLWKTLIYQSDLRFISDPRLPYACIIRLFPTLPLTNAKKATVSVLYWYIKLSELFNSSQFLKTPVSSSSRGRNLFLCVCVYLYLYIFILMYNIIIIYYLLLIIYYILFFITVLIPANPRISILGTAILR